MTEVPVHWLSLVALSVWILVIHPRSRRLPVDHGPHDGLLAFALGWLGGQLLMAPALWLLLPADLPADTPADELPLVSVIGAQSLAFGLATLGALAWVRSRGARLADVGLRRTGGGMPAPLAALAAWLALAPLLLLAQAASAAGFEALGWDPAPQAHLARFLEQDGGASGVAWFAMAVWLPLCEELLYRGLLYGALRRRLPPAVAMLLAGLLFGAAHDPVVMLPVAVLGAALAWLYERTGSLSVPILVHCLQNGATLWLASEYPDLATGLITP